MRGEAQWKVEVLAEAADGRTAGWLVRKFKMMGATGGKA